MCYNGVRNTSFECFVKFLFQFLTKSELSFRELLILKKNSFEKNIDKITKTFSWAFVTCFYRV